MIQHIVLAIGAAIVAVLGTAATRPDTFSVERSVQVQAPAERIYPLLADFRRFPDWSPWEHRDPAMKRGYSGAASGVGAAYAWNGNDDVGQGRMEIIEATEPTLVRMRLDFLRPVQAQNIAEFRLQQADPGGTRVTWRMEGPNPYLAKVMQLFISMDRLVGSDFDAGLAKLKQVAESG